LEYIFTFQNTHEAIYGERLLLAGKIAVRVMALPAKIAAGCGICLRVNTGELERAKRLLAQGDVKISGLYFAQKKGQEVVYTTCSL
jgi:hypothetical protein